MLLPLLAVAVLLLVPGGLMLLAPWSVRPFLSAAFWIASWWWLPRLGPGRAAFLQGALVAFGVLGLARLLKPIEPRRPSLAVILVCAGMALLLPGLPWALWPLPPETSFDALTARLLVDRDGVPETYEPLLPISAFALRPSGLSGWAADIGLISGSGVLETTLVTVGVARALLLLAAFHVLRRGVGERRAALVSVCLAFGVACLGGLAARTLLGAALALVAAPHVSSRDKAPAVASGVLLGASLLSGGILPPLVCLVAAVGNALRASRGDLRRIVLATAVAGLVVLPSLVRVGPTGLLASPGWSRVRSAERPPDADDRAAMAWLRVETGPLAVVCAEAAPAATWIPAVAGRAVVLDGRIGPLPRGMAPFARPRPCALGYARTDAPGAGTVRFRRGPVTILEISNSLR